VALTAIIALSVDVPCLLTAQCYVLMDACSQVHALEMSGDQIENLQLIIKDLQAENKALRDRVRLMAVQLARRLQVLCSDRRG